VGAAPGAFAGQAVGAIAKPWGETDPRKPRHEDEPGPVKPEDVEKEKERKEKAEKKDKAASLAIAYVEKRSNSDRQLVETLKRVKAAAEHEIATTEDVDVASDIVHGEKQAAASWAKKLVKKYKAEGKTVPEWLEKMTGSKKAAMEKNASIGRIMAGAGRRLAQGGVGRMFGGRVGRLGAKMGLSGMGRKLGKGLMRRGGLMEAGGGLRGMMGRNPLWTGALAGGAGVGLGGLLAGGGGQPAAQQVTAPQQSQPMSMGGQQIDPRILYMLMMQGVQGAGMPKWGMEKNAALGIGAAGRLLSRMKMPTFGGGLQRFNKMLGATRAGGVLNRMGAPLHRGVRNMAVAGQTAASGLRSRLGAWRQARQAARRARRIEKMKPVVRGGGMRRLGTALKRGLPLGAAGGAGFAAAGGFDDSESGDASQQVAAIGEQPNFVQRMMGGLGDYVGEDLGMEPLGNMIRENPYASLGVGVGGGGLLMYLLYQLLAGRGGGGGQPQMAAMYG
jgi:hypothetical protein